MRTYADLRFRTTAEGGRHGATPSGQFSCQMEVAGQCFDCRVLGDSVSPGQAATRSMLMFLSPELVAPLLKVGTAFTLREGARAIADGRVVEIDGVTAAETR